MIDYTYPLAHLEKYKGCEWTLEGDNYEGLKWLCKDRPKPSEDELKAAYADCVKEHRYKENRKTEMPPLQDQLMAMWHGMDSGEIPKCAVFYDAIKAIHVKYPKPE